MRKSNAKGFVLKLFFGVFFLSKKITLFFKEMTRAFYFYNGTMFEEIKREGEGYVG